MKKSPGSGRVSRPMGITPRPTITRNFTGSQVTNYSKSDEDPDDPETPRWLKIVRVVILLVLIGGVAYSIYRLVLWIF
jgi:hypothetical protein